MQIFKIYPQGFAANSYLLTQDGVHAVAIDPAQPRILDEAQKRALKVTHVLLTHGHFDHIGGVAACRRREPRWARPRKRQHGGAIRRIRSRFSR